MPKRDDFLDYVPRFLMGDKDKRLWAKKHGIDDHTINDRGFRPGSEGRVKKHAFQKDQRRKVPVA